MSEANQSIDSKPTESIEIKPNESNVVKQDSYTIEISKKGVELKANTNMDRKPIKSVDININANKNSENGSISMASPVSKKFFVNKKLITQPKRKCARCTMLNAFNCEHGTSVRDTMRSSFNDDANKLNASAKHTSLSPNARGSQKPVNKSTDKKIV